MNTAENYADRVHLASEYARLSNQLSKQLRAITKSLGLKCPSNPGCGGATFSDYTITPQNEGHIRRHIAMEGAHQFYGELKHPSDLAGTIAKNDKEYQAMMNKFLPVWESLQNEWSKVFTQL